MQQIFIKLLSNHCGKKEKKQRKMKKGGDRNRMGNETEMHHMRELERGKLQSLNQRGVR